MFGKTLYEELIKFSKKDKVRAHMPGHNGGEGLSSKFKRNAFKIDLTELDGTDELRDPRGIIKKSLERAANAFGAKRTYYLVNGSTLGLEAAILAAAKMCIRDSSLSQKLDRRTGVLSRLGISFGVTDEIFAVSVTNPCTLGPVSYTHLDVYKRQIQGVLKQTHILELSLLLLLNLSKAQHNISLVYHLVVDNSDINPAVFISETPQKIAAEVMNPIFHQLTYVFKREAAHKPVSYTHLDVYKRQIFMRDLFAISSMTGRCVMLLIVFAIAADPILRFLSAVFEKDYTNTKIVRMFKKLKNS